MDINNLFAVKIPVSIAFGIENYFKNYLNSFNTTYTTLQAKLVVKD